MTEDDSRCISSKVDLSKAFATFGKSSRRNNSGGTTWLHQLKMAWLVPDDRLLLFSLIKNRFCEAKRDIFHIELPSNVKFTSDGAKSVQISVGPLIIATLVSLKNLLKFVVLQQNQSDSF